jgi:DNA-binding transcriptional MerR regulator
MKNSTQITFAFQDSPGSGDNPGVGVRIKSLKKSGTETGKEDQPELGGAEEKTTNPDLFSEASQPSGNTGNQAGDIGRDEPQTKDTAVGEPQTGDIAVEENRTADTVRGETRIHETRPEENKNQNAGLEKNQSYAPAVGEIHASDLKSDEDQHSGGTSFLPEIAQGLTDHNSSAGSETLIPAGNEADADLPVFRSSREAASEDTRIELPGSEGQPAEDAETDDQTDSANITEKTTKSTRGRKSLKNIDDGADLINIPPDEILFQKQYYAIGEVAEMFHVNQSLLRFWETEFDIIQPRKNRKGDRHFRPVDIKNLLLIHDLLRRRKLTIEGAKDFLKKNKRSPERFAMIQSLQKIKGFILEIKATL